MTDKEMVLAALRRSGLDVSSVWTLVNTRENYDEAIPALIEMLAKVEDLGEVEGIARALTIKGARPAAARPLIDKFRHLLADRSQRAETVRWAIANALTVVADKNSIDDIIELLASRESGTARKMLALALGKLKAEKAVPLLIEALKDEQIVGHAAIALGKIKAQEAQLHLEQLTSYPVTWIRKEVKKALERIQAGPSPLRAKRAVKAK
jgi:HEAT repeat protein